MITQAVRMRAVGKDLDDAALADPSAGTIGYHALQFGLQQGELFYAAFHGRQVDVAQSRQQRRRMCESARIGAGLRDAIHWPRQRFAEWQIRQQRVNRSNSGQAPN